MVTASSAVSLCLHRGFPLCDSSPFAISLCAAVVFSLLKPIILFPPALVSLPKIAARVSLYPSSLINPSPGDRHGENPIKTISSRLAHHTPSFRQYDSAFHQTRSFRAFQSRLTGLESAPLMDRSRCGHYSRRVSACWSCLSNKKNSNCHGNLHCTDGRHGQSILAHALASEAPLPSRLPLALGPHKPVNILQSCGRYLSKVRARHLQSSTSRANVSAVTMTSRPLP